jgi:hypothetical protein
VDCRVFLSLSLINASRVLWHPKIESSQLQEQALYRSQRIFQWIKFNQLLSTWKSATDRIPQEQNRFLKASL